MQPDRLIQSKADLAAWQHIYANYHVLLAMVQLGVFDLLADGIPRNCETLAEALHADARAIDICGRILAKEGLLTYENSQYRLSQAAQNLAAPLNDLRWEWRRQNNYTSLIKTIRTGKPAMVTSGGVLEEEEDDARQFLQMLYRNSANSVEQAMKVIPGVLEQIPQPSDRPYRILDLGGGHGRYSAAFATLPNVEATLFDREVATKIAHELSGNKFKSLSGDFLRDDLGGSYDVVFMSYIVSGIAIEAVQSLFNRLRQIVVPSGTLIIQDMFVQPSQLEPEEAIDFNLTLLLENERGRFRTVSELCDLMSKAGFVQWREIKLKNEEYGFLIGT